MNRQMKKPPATLRSAADLIGAGLVPEAKRDAIERLAAIYAIGVTGTVAGLMGGLLAGAFAWVVLNRLLDAKSGPDSLPMLVSIAGTAMLSG